MKPCWLTTPLYALAIMTCFSTVGQADDSSARLKEVLTFHAAFDGTTDANVALGDASIYTATNLSREEVKAGIHTDSVGLVDDGRFGGSLRFFDTTEPVVFYRGEGNFPYREGEFEATISFWLKVDPEKELKPGYVDPLQITDKQWNDASLFVDFTKDDTPRHFRLGVFSDYKFWNPKDTPWDDIAVEDRPMVEVAKTPFASSAWTHVAVSLVGINSEGLCQATLYLNGVSQGTLWKQQKFSWNPADVAMMLGIKYIGGLDDFAIFRAALTPAGIQYLYQLPGGVSSLSEVDNDASAATETQADEWIQLFNGKDLSDWQVKIRYHELGDNFGNTFRVEDGILKVGYEAYDEFKEQFGHLFYKTPYSSYDLRVEYRFTGQQCKGGPGWAIRNSGLMLHGQDPATMAIGQDFPVSIEVQLLGGNGTDPRTTANLCTPGTNVVMNGELIRRHCTSSTSETYHGDQWVTTTVKVRGNRLIEHYVEGKKVLEYTEPQLDDRDPDAKRLLESQDKMLSGGTISLQSESHPVEFRKVELRVVPE